MSDFRDGVHSEQPDLLSLIRQELQGLNASFSTLSTSMQKVYAANQKSDIREEKFETFLKKYFTSTQEQDLRKKSHETDQLKTLVDINRQILKESQKSSEAIKKFQEIQRSKEYQNAGKDIANEYHKAMRKEHGSHVMGTLAHHFGENYSGIGALLSRIPGLEAFSPHKAPGDFMHQKKAREQGLYNNAMRSFEDLNSSTRGSSAVDNYDDMRGTEKALNDKVMDSLKAQAGYLTENYTRGYKRRAGKGGRNSPIFGGGPSGGGQLGAFGSASLGRQASPQQLADEERASMSPSPADLSKQTAGSANGFLLLYNFFRDQANNKDPLEGAGLNGKEGGGGLFSKMIPALAGMLPLLMEAAIPLLIGGGVLALILAAVASTNQRNKDASDIRAKNGLTDQEVISKYGTTNLESSQSAAYLKNGTKSGVSDAQAYKAASDAAQMNINGSGDVSKVLISAQSKLRDKSPWDLPGPFKLTAGPNGTYLYGGVVVPADAQEKVMYHDEQGIFNHSNWAQFAKDASSGPYSKRAFKAGGMIPGGSETAVPITAHGGELMLNASEVNKLRKNAVEGNGLGKDGTKILEQLLEVNQALLEELRKNTEVTSAKKESTGGRSSPTADAPKGPSRSFQRSN